MPGTDLRVVSYASDDAQLLTVEVQAEYGRRYGGEGDISPIDLHQFDAPEGHFVMIYVDDVPAAMGGWRRGGPGGATDGEIKRMFVRPAFARRGLARTILAELERTAIAAGITRLVLETGTAQPEAIALYESSGYATIPAFGFYADYDDSVHLAKTIASTP
ncbi:GNAT family N-acetyltransferase [Aeromicrobium fastidiosum]|uniref:GNAT family N-acetyltransferase n=1 Tax=Aeromicrobium fastidiosum TaxID=52699 RepID=A0A641ANS8_9ACTN|nr:GNAT family N-acetyltransferase [Aeromicrobium fastidiosum]KAA1376299.1 GNAT family N-acetyltransferase [Aeromicrobium fastidiosum]MBP2391803.1 GNAT superfamily N-acetyltransferase [Aeromicrobium fastidiosum]